MVRQLSELSELFFWLLAREGVVVSGNTEWVNYAKAIGIILVVYGHVARGLYNAGIDFYAPVVILADSIIYSFHMPLFFFLSGLFFYTSILKKGAVNLVLGKIDTLLYPYFIWSIFQGCVELYLADYTNGMVSMSEIVSLLWSPRAQFWFLYSLFLIFLFSSMFYSFISNKFSIIFFLLSALLYLFPNIAPETYASKVIVENLVFFVFGIMFFIHSDIDRFSCVFCSVLWSCLFVSSQWLFHIYLSLDYTNKGIESLVLALISIIFVVSISANLAKRNYTSISFLGASSMAIYLMHVLSGSGVRIILIAFGVDSFWVHLLLGSFLGILIPIAAISIINRLKIPYVFSAPISTSIKAVFRNLSCRAGERNCK